MAGVNLTLSFEENEINPENNSQFPGFLQKFQNKHQEILDQFEGKFFSDGYILVSGSDYQFDVSTRSQNQFEKAVCKFLSNIDEVVGIEAYQMYGLGHEPYPQEFYKDLFELMSLGRTMEGKEFNLDEFQDMEYSILIAESYVDNVAGQYSGSYILKFDGTLKAQFDLYEEDSDW